MDSIGNDIIDLNFIDASRSRNQRFFSKFISESEQNLFERSGLSFEVFVWLLWSIKESVYKCQKRMLPGTLFSPLIMTVQELDACCDKKGMELNAECFEQDSAERCHWRASVSLGARNFYARSLTSSRFIFTTARLLDSSHNVYGGIKFINDSGYDNQHSEVRSFALQRFGQIFGRSEELIIEKNIAGIPFLFRNGSNTGVVLSFSHHYHFIAYSFTGNELFC
jgi:phosphopantetheinyl transferase (holo-ACP synthase)